MYQLIIDYCYWRFAKKKKIIVKYGVKFLLNHITFKEKVLVKLLVFLVSFLSKYLTNASLGLLVNTRCHP